MFIATNCAQLTNLIQHFAAAAAAHANRNLKVIVIQQTNLDPQYHSLLLAAAIEFRF